MWSTYILKLYSRVFKVSSWTVKFKIFDHFIKVYKWSYWRNAVKSGLHAIGRQLRVRVMWPHLQSQCSVQVYDIALCVTKTFFCINSPFSFLFIQKPFSFIIVLFCRWISRRNQTSHWDRHCCIETWPKSMFSVWFEPSMVHGNKLSSLNNVG